MSTAPKPEGALWDVEQAAAFLGMSVSWVQKRSAEGRLPTIHMGRALRFNPEVIKAFARGEVAAAGDLVKVSGPKTSP